MRYDVSAFINSILPFKCKSPFIILLCDWGGDLLHESPNHTSGVVTFWTLLPIRVVIAGDLPEPDARFMKRTRNYVILHERQTSLATDTVTRRQAPSSISSYHLFVDCFKNNVFLFLIQKHF